MFSYSENYFEQPLCYGMVQDFSTPIFMVYIRLKVHGFGMLRSLPLNKKLFKSDFITFRQTPNRSKITYFSENFILIVQLSKFLHKKAVLKIKAIVYNAKQLRNLQ